MATRAVLSLLVSLVSLVSAVGVHDRAARLRDRRGAAIPGGHHRRLLGAEDRNQPDGLDSARAPEVRGDGPVRRPADHRGGRLHARQAPRSRAGAPGRRARSRSRSRAWRAGSPATSARFARRATCSKPRWPTTKRRGNRSTARCGDQGGRRHGRRLRAREEDLHLRPRGTEDRPDQPVSRHRRRTLLEAREVLPRRARQGRLSARGRVRHRPHLRAGSSAGRQSARSGRSRGAGDVPLHSARGRRGVDRRSPIRAGRSTRSGRTRRTGRPTSPARSDRSASTSSSARRTSCRT